MRRVVFGPIGGEYVSVVSDRLERRVIEGRTRARLLASPVASIPLKGGRRVILGENPQVIGIVVVANFKGFLNTRVANVILFV